MKNKVTPILITAALILGGVLALPSKSMNVDGVDCSSFASCGSLADAGSVWTISGDWSSSGKLSVSRSNISIIGDGARLQSATFSGNNVTFKGFEVTGSPAETNGVFWTGENGTIADLVIHDTGLTGFRFYTAFNNSLTNVVSYDNLRGTAGNSDGVNCSGGGSNTFDNLDVYNNGDDGLDVWNCPNNIIRNSTAHDNRGGGDQNGFKLGPGGGNQVINNIAYGNGKTGFASNEGGNTFIDNLSYNNGQHGFAEWRGARGGVQYSTYVNNTAYGNGGKNFSNSAGSYVTYSGNSTTPPANATQTASSTPNLPTLTHTPSKTSTPVPTVTSTATPTPFICPQGLALMEDARLLICYRVK